MRLMKLELKRVLKTRLTLILLTLSLVLSLVMAYIPVTYSYFSLLDENGNSENFRDWMPSDMRRPCNQTRRVW